MSPQSLQALRVAMLFSCAALGARAEAVSPAEVKEEGKKRFHRELTKVEVELIERTSQGSEADFGAGDMGPVVEERAAKGRKGARPVDRCRLHRLALHVAEGRGDGDAQGESGSEGCGSKGCSIWRAPGVPFPLAIVASHIPDVVDCRRRFRSIRSSSTAPISV